MKNRRKTMLPVVIALIMACSLALAACGSSRSSGSYAAAEAKEAAYDSGYTMSNAAYTEEGIAYQEDSAEAPAAEASGVSQKAYNGDVKLIYRANVSAETTDIDKAIADLEALAASMDGYVEYSDIGNYGYGNDYSRYANYTIRIPSEKYEAFLAALNASGSCNVRSLAKSTEDIGAEYADTEARLKTLRIKQERLQELLSKAENMEDIIAIENALTDVEYEIEWNSSSLNRYDALVNYSTVSIYLQQVARETQTTDSSSLGERIVNSFRNGISSFATGFEDFMVAVAGAIIPILIVIAVIIVIIVLFCKAVKNGKKERPLKEKKGTKKENTEKETDDTVIK